MMLTFASEAGINSPFMKTNFVSITPFRPAPLLDIPPLRYSAGKARHFCRSACGRHCSQHLPTPVWMASRRWNDLAITSYHAASALYKPSGKLLLYPLMDGLQAAVKKCACPGLKESVLRRDWRCGFPGREWD